MTWKPLDPYAGPPEITELTGLALIQEVAFYKRSADRNGESYDPEWDQWIRDDPAASLLLLRARGE